MPSLIDLINLKPAPETLALQAKQRSAERARENQHKDTKRKREAYRNDPEARERRKANNERWRQQQSPEYRKELYLRKKKRLAKMTESEYRDYRIKRSAELAKSTEAMKKRIPVAPGILRRCPKCSKWAYREPSGRCDLSCDCGHTWRARLDATERPPGIRRRCPECRKFGYYDPDGRTMRVTCVHCAYEWRTYKKVLDVGK